MKTLMTISALVAGMNVTTPVLADSCKVPLRLVNIGTKSQPAYKVGINVGLGGGAPRLYEFDTGGSGFWAAYNGALPASNQWWGTYSLLSEGSMSIQYTSGNGYTANLVQTQIALYKPSTKTPTQPLCSTQTPVQMSQITDFQNSDPKSVKAWNNGLQNGKAPLYHHFWGDFGAGLHPTISTAGTQGVYTILNQFATGAQHNGFIVHIGDIKSPKRQQRYVQIGLNADDIASFPYQFPMNPDCPDSGPTESGCASSLMFSNTPVNTFTEAQFNADVTLRGRKQKPEQVLPNLSMIIDSGATLANIFQNPDCVTDCIVNPVFLYKPQPSPDTNPVVYTGYFKSGYSATISGTTISNGSFSTALTQSGNSQVRAAYVVKKTNNSKTGAMNTGIMFYSEWDVMYDVSTGVIGFRPAK